MELNPDHPVLTKMNALFDVDKDSNRLADYIELIYDQALLTEGSQLKNPLRFAQLVSELMVDVFGEEAGKGARSAMGVGSLPGNVPVEIEAVFEVGE